MPDTMCCDVLAGEQGPSCPSMKQLLSLKVIHVRFIEFTGASNVAKVGDDSPARKQIKRNDKNPGPSVALSEPCTSRGSPSKFVPRSLSVAEMLRLGKLITKTTDVIDIRHFSMTEMVWSGKATPVEFNIEREPFGTGGFRKAFKASGSGEFKGSTWVVKRYLENAKRISLSWDSPLKSTQRKWFRCITWYEISPQSSKKNLLHKTTKYFLERHFPIRRSSWGRLESSM